VAGKANSMKNRCDVSI